MIRGSGPAANSILIVGDGASGVIPASHLLRQGGPDLRVTMVEKRSAIGRGIAYGTTEPDHRLNVRATNMSALADEPGHFCQWLKGQGVAAADFASVYAPRAACACLEATLREAQASWPPARLHIAHETCVAVTPHAASVEATLGNGSTIAAQVAVLATGHEENPLSERPYEVRFEVTANAHVASAANGVSTSPTSSQPTTSPAASRR